VKRLNFLFSVSPGSAEALDEVEKIKHHLTDYFLSNISVKNYQNCSMFIEDIASQTVMFYFTAGQFIFR